MNNPLYIQQRPNDMRKVCKDFIDFMANGRFEKRGKGGRAVFLSDKHSPIQSLDTRYLSKSNTNPQVNYLPILLKELRI